MTRLSTARQHAFEAEPLLFKGCVISRRSDHSEVVEGHLDVCEGLWNHEAVPALQLPKARILHVNREDGTAGQLRELHQAGVHVVAGAARSIWRDGHDVPVVDRA